jgi:splicing factor 3B subunit 2
LYGDVFGTHVPPPPPSEFVQPIERHLWGGLTEPHYAGAEEESEEEEEAEEALAAATEEEAIRQEGGEELRTGMISKEGFDLAREGLVTPSGLSSIPAGLVTPDDIELRKDQRRISGAPSLESSLAATTTTTPRQLYRVLQEKEVSNFLKQ